MSRIAARFRNTATTSARGEAVADYQAVLELLDESKDALRAAEVQRRSGDELYELNR
jgi:hypothetical protein